MRETIKLLGEELRKIYASTLKRPLPWSIIDPLSTIEEAEEEKEEGAEEDKDEKLKLPK